MIKAAGFDARGRIKVSPCYYLRTTVRQQARLNAVPESPLRVYEATRWSLAVDATKLTAPILIVSGALDILTPPETGAALAVLYGATYQLEPAHGHNVLLGEGARRIAEDVIAWVVGRLAR
jgi:pimeloyl-ACP methyl ester carboxylesterase